MQMRWMWLAGLLVACISEENFTDEFIVGQCALLMECQGSTMALFDDAASCEAQYADWMPAWSESCTYDPHAARRCLKALEETDCNDRDGLSDECDPVYTGVCPWAD